MSNKKKKNTHQSVSRKISGTDKLPNVRFIDRGAIPNAEMIRHTDIVWIQTNAIPHMFYNTIIDRVRKHNIPVRYFTYSSTAKCAEQIVREDCE